MPLQQANLKGGYYNSSKGDLWWHTAYRTRSFGTKPQYQCTQILGFYSDTTEIRTAGGSTEAGKSYSSTQHSFCGTQAPQFRTALTCGAAASQ